MISGGKDTLLVLSDLNSRKILNQVVAHTFGVTIAKFI
jgi:hypothetical protein